MGGRPGEQLGIGTDAGIEHELLDSLQGEDLFAGDQPLVLFARNPGEQIGWALRSKPGCLPLFVSPGNKVAMASCAELVMEFVTRYRLPEPTRLADRLASRRGPIDIDPSLALTPADG